MAPVRPRKLCKILRVNRSWLTDHGRDNSRWRFPMPRYSVHARFAPCPISNCPNLQCPSLQCPSLQTQPRRRVATLLALGHSVPEAGRRPMRSCRCAMPRCLQPSNAIIQHDLGLACLEVAAVPDALRHCSGPSPATRATPMPISAWESPRKNGRHRGAITAYDAATALLPS